MILSFLRSCCLIRNSQVRNFSGFETYLMIAIGLADNHSSMTILGSNGRSPCGHTPNRAGRARWPCAECGSAGAVRRKAVAARSQVSLLRRAGRGLEVKFKELRRHRAPHLRFCPRKYTRMLARRRRSMHTRARTDERATGRRGGAVRCTYLGTLDPREVLGVLQVHPVGLVQLRPDQVLLHAVQRSATRCMHRAANHATAARSADGANGGQRAAVHSRLWPRGTAEAGARGR